MKGVYYQLIMRDGYFENCAIVFPAVFIKQSIRFTGFPEDEAKVEMNSRA